jgi:hypothetical protein
VITDKRVMLAEGLVTHNVGMMPLSKVTDLTFRRTFGGRPARLRHPDRRVGGPDPGAQQDQVHAAPDEIYEALSELIFGEKGKTRATGMLARPRLRG